MMDTQSRPIDEIQIGRIRASIWEERTQEGSRHWVSVHRETEPGSCAERSDRFASEDLPAVARVLGLASARICNLLHEGGETA